LDNKLNTPSSSQKNRLIAKNTLMLYFRMILIMLVSLFTSRVILNTLGVEDFGIYNVVGGVVAMFTFFNNAMSSATQRFLSFEIGKGDFVQLIKTFNATLIIHIVIALLIFILAETLGLWFIKTYLVIPPERMEAAQLVYHFSVLSFIVTVIQVPYNATIIAHERMNVYAYVSILEVALKLLIVFLLTVISYDKLKLYGILYFAVVLFIAAIYILYTKKNFEESKFVVVRDKELYKTLVSFTGWSLYENLALVAKGQGINIILNIFFGPVVNAAQGIANQVQAALNSFVSNFQMAVKPQIIKSYASDERNYLNSLIFSSTKFSFYLLFLLSLPIILEINQVLKIWLKTVPAFTPVFTVLIILIGLIICYSGPMKTAVQATGRIKKYQIVIGTLQLIILPVSYIFFKLRYSPETTFYITIIIEIISLGFRLYFLRKLMNFPVIGFIKNVLLKNILILLLSISLPLFIRSLMDENITRMIIVSIVSITWSSSVVYFIGLNNSEKLFLLNYFSKMMGK
jgi:O-antigen/teichoic acid export membrane protein